jgi:hypothetical protein
VKAIVAKAVDIAAQFGGIDGAHHKQWVIDQMVRALLGPEEYAHWVAGMNDSPEEYGTWDEGIAP